MKPIRKPGRGESLPCDEIHEDDCIDPRDFFRKTTHRPNLRKDHQLCKQVYKTLSTILVGRFADPVLQDLIVESVTPAPNASRLRVIVRLSTLGAEVGPAKVRAALNRVHGVIRTEVAEAINRRRAPELVYDVAVDGGTDQ